MVLLHGSVKGMDHEAQCEILARRLPVPANADPDPSGSYTYTECSVIGAPADLPDGEYTAHFEAHLLKTTLRNGLWLSSGPAFRHSELPALDD